MAELEIEPLLVSDLDEAQQTLEERLVPITGILIPTDHTTANLKRRVKRLQRAGPASGLTFVSVGKTPTPKARRELAAAGLTVALWEPYDAATLRFQLNRTLSHCHSGDQRAMPHVPTDLLARVFVGGRTKQAVVFSLSDEGAFLDTPRASMDGARIEIELCLPTRPVQLQAEVLYANVPGNLQRTNLPVGMGVRFRDVAVADIASIRSYVEERLRELNV